MTGFRGLPVTARLEDAPPSAQWKGQPVLLLGPHLPARLSAEPAGPERQGSWLPASGTFLHRAANPGQEWGSAPGRSPPPGGLETQPPSRPSCPRVDRPSCAARPAAAAPRTPFLPHFSLGPTSAPPGRLPSCPRHNCPLGLHSFFPSDLKAPSSCGSLPCSPVDGRFSEAERRPWPLPSMTLGLLTLSPAGWLCDG